MGRLFIKDGLSYNSSGYELLQKGIKDNDKNVIKVLDYIIKYRLGNNINLSIDRLDSSKAYIKEYNGIWYIDISKCNINPNNLPICKSGIPEYGFNINIPNMGLDQNDLTASIINQGCIIVDEDSVKHLFKTFNDNYGLNLNISYAITHEYGHLITGQEYYVKKQNIRDDIINTFHLVSNGEALADAYCLFKKVIMLEDLISFRYYFHRRKLLKEDNKSHTEIKALINNYRSIVCKYLNTIDKYTKVNLYDKVRIIMSREEYDIYSNGFIRK